MKGRVFTYAGVGNRTVKRSTAKALEEAVGRTGSWGYEFAVIDPATGKRRTVSAGGFTTRKDAQAALSARLVEVGNRPASAVRRADGSITVRDFAAAEYLPSLLVNLKPTTASTYRTIVETYIVPHIGGLRLRDVTPGTLSTLYATLGARGGRGGRSLSPTTVHHAHVSALRLFELAREQGLIKSNPAGEIAGRARPKAGTRNPDRIRHWTVDEAKRFLDSVAGDRLAALFEVAVGVGLRRGELCGLQWRDVDLDRGSLTVRRNRVVVDAYDVVEGTPKTSESERQIDLDRALVEALRGHRRRQREERIAWGDAWAGPAAETARYVFANEDGSPLHPQHVNRLTERLARRAGVPFIGVHGLRHTSATLSLAAGVPLKVVSERLGHSSTEITADLYMHVDGTMQRDASEAVSRLLGRA